MSGVFGHRFSWERLTADRKVQDREGWTSQGELTRVRRTRGHARRL